VAVGLAVAAVLLAACGAGDDDVVPRRRLAGFGEVGFRVSGSTAERCALLAATAEARARGLMGQDDLRGYDGMVFVHEADTTGGYYMFRTTLPLSIAWFDAEGRFVEAADMAPCPADAPGDCPSHRPTRPYRQALEVPRGELDDLGVGPGAVLTLTGAC
jgi:uncharacterized membrane protein (UPF0127 family)